MYKIIFYIVNFKTSSYANKESLIKGEFLFLYTATLLKIYIDHDLVIQNQQSVFNYSKKCLNFAKNKIQHGQNQVSDGQHIYQI